MKKLLITTALALAPVAAAAADLPNRAVAPAPVVAGAPNWGGFYVGVQAGAAKLTSTHTDEDYWYWGYINRNTHDTAATFGLRTGYDFIIGSGIFGVLVEGSVGSLNSQNEVTPSTPSYSIGSKVNFLGSARAKLGGSVDRLAVFVTAGLAYANIEHRYNETDGTGELFRGDGTRFGYVFGLGAAYALTSNISVGLDVSRYQFGAKKHQLLESDGTTYTGSDFTLKDSVNTVTLNLNYRF